MSQIDTSTSTSTSASTTFSSSSSNQPLRVHDNPASANPFTKLDNRLAGVSDRILPKQPYLITIPSDFPYRRHLTDLNRWFLHTPFSRQEEQLQYMSLLLHQDDDEALLRVDGTRIDEDGALLAYSHSPRSELPSRPETPVEAAPKKKISLKDYKTKDKSNLNTPEPRPIDDFRRQALKSHKEERDVKRDDLSSKPPTLLKTEPVPTAAKTTLPSVQSISKPAQARPVRHGDDSQPPTKKRKLSIEAKSNTTGPVNGLNAKEKAKDKRILPELLSPDMPSSERKNKSRDLPVLLSPDLPQALEMTTVLPSNRTDEVRSILKSIDGPAKGTEKKSTDIATKESTSGRVRSESQTSAKSVVPVVKISSTPSQPLASAIKTPAPLTNGKNPSPRPTQELVTILKYGKKNRKRVEMLLKLAPRQKKGTLPVAGKTPVPATKPPSSITSSESYQKRPNEAIPEQPNKKIKTSSSLLELHPKPDRPSTPLLKPSDRSPLPAERPRSVFSTPKKDLKSIAMQRVTSTDTTEAHTPSHDIGRTSTPLPTGHSSHPKASPAATSASFKGEEQNTWVDIQNRVHSLGRILKKEGQKLANEGQGKEKQQGMVLLIEALLCFMLSCASQAQARPHVDAGWSTILPYYKMVLRLTDQHYKHLHGLLVQLGAVYRQHWHQEHIRQLAKETLPEEHLVSAPTPGSDGNTRSEADSGKRQEAFSRLRDELVRNSIDLKKAWFEGSRKLSLDVIESDYPSTWGKRSKDITKRNDPDKANPRDLTKDFYLPLDVTTNVFEATHFALAFLREWSLIESVQWKARIEL